MTNSSVSSGSISAVAVSTTPANRLYYGTSDGQVWRLDNANTGNPTPVEIYSGKGLSTGYVSCIAIDPTDADNLLVVFSNYSIRSVFYSSNGGSSYSDISGNLEQFSDGSGNGPSTRWAEILPGSDGMTYFVGTSTGLYSTTTLDGSSTVWTQEGSATIGNVVVSMIDSRISDGLVVAATHGSGIYSGFINNPVPVELTEFSGQMIDGSFELSLQWKTVTENNNFGFDIERAPDSQPRNWQKVGFIPGGGTINEPREYIFTDNVKAAVTNGHESLYYRLKQTDLDGSYVYSEEVRVALDYHPDTFVLHQNFPNPFNPATTISFELPRTSRIKLRIYNLNGQLVEILIEELRETGYHEVSWRPADPAMASGVYFYRLEGILHGEPAQHFSLSRRMLFVK
jgi:hypothetical protein